MITQDTIAKIFDSARVEEVIQDFVTLKKRGVNLLGNCPFHDEKTPSFTVSPAKGIYKCFGCGKAGSSVNFIMEHEQMTYPEALRYLAQKYNIEIEESEQTAEQKEQKSSRESLQIVNTYAQKYFTEQLLNSEEGKSIALSYFKERGFTEETIEKFQLGYNPDSWGAFTEEAISKGYQIEYLEKAGLTKVKEDKKYDFFKGRVMFPIHNITGKVIAFGGRTLRNDKKIAKYFNSPETELYNKSKVLYGLYFAKKDMMKLDNCLLVEGYTDVISLNQRGLENVVSSSGTSLTEGQIKLIKRYTSNITILFDGDVAGIKASFRGIDMILKEGLNVRVVLFPDGEDPDSYAKKMSRPEMEDYIKDNSKDFIHFKSDLLLEETKGNPVKKAGLIKDIITTISVISDEVKRSIYMSECATWFDISEKALYNELNKILRTSFQKERQKRVRETEEPDFSVPQFRDEVELKYDKATCEHEEKDIIRLLLNFGSKQVQFTQKNEEGEEEEVNITASEFIIYSIENDEIKFERETYQKIYDQYYDSIKREELLDIKRILLNPDIEMVETAVSLTATKYELSINWKDKHQIYVVTEEMKLKFALEHSILALQLKKVEISIQKIQEELKQDRTEKELIALLTSQLSFIEIKKAISEKLNRVILK